MKLIAKWPVTVCYHYYSCYLLCQ